MGLRLLVGRGLGGFSDHMLDRMAFWGTASLIVGNGTSLNIRLGEGVFWQCDQVFFLFIFFKLWRPLSLVFFTSCTLPSLARSLWRASFSGFYSDDSLRLLVSLALVQSKHDLENPLDRAEITVPGEKVQLRNDLLLHRLSNSLELLTIN